MNEAHYTIRNILRNEAVNKVMRMNEIIGQLDMEIPAIVMGTKVGNIHCDEEDFRKWDQEHPLLRIC